MSIQTAKMLAFDSIKSEAYRDVIKEVLAQVLSKPTNTSISDFHPTAFVTDRMVLGNKFWRRNLITQAIEQMKVVSFLYANYG